MRKLVFICIVSKKNAVSDSFIEMINSSLVPLTIIVSNALKESNIDSKHEVFFVEYKSIYKIIYLIKDLIKTRKKINNFLESKVFIFSPLPINSLISCFLNKKITLWLHDPYCHIGEKLKVRIVKNIDEFILAFFCRVEKIIVSSFFLKKSVLSIKRWEKTPVNIVPLPYLKSFVNVAESAKKIKNKIIFFGRVEYYKGLDILLESLPLISRGVGSIELVIAGTGEHDISSLINILAPDIKIIRKNYFVSNEELAKDIATSEVAVFPYRESTGSMVIPLSVSLGCKVVVTDVGSFPEISKMIGANVEVVSPTPKGIAIGIEKQLSSNFNYSNNGVKCFSPENIINELISKLDD